MRLAPGTPLAASLMFREDQPPLPVGRLAMTGAWRSSNGRRG
jgi:hypothetical protein